LYVGKTAHNKQNTDAPFVGKVLLWSLNAVAHELVCGFRREKNESFVAASAELCDSSQQHCGVLPDVSCNCPHRKMKRLIFVLAVLDFPFIGSFA
jgi:hypothetical protein